MRRGGTADGLGSRGRQGAGTASGGAESVQRGKTGRRSDIGEVLFEFWPSGRYVKVSAMHSRSLTEVSIVGDASRSQAELEDLALKKLRYVLGRKPG